MLIIRLQALGRKRRKHFRVVVAEKHRSVSKKAQEILGWYNPYSKEHSFDQEKITKQLSCGAQMSSTVNSLFKKYGISTEVATANSEKKSEKLEKPKAAKKDSEVKKPKAAKKTEAVKKTTKPKAAAKKAPKASA